MRKTAMAVLFCAQCFVALLMRCETAAHAADDVRRVVSVTPDATEIVYSLGKQDMLVGVTQYCPYNEDHDKPVIGNILEPNIEKIIALEPDIVFAARVGTRKETVDRLRQSGIEVAVLDPVRTFDDLYARIARVGGILGADIRAKELNITLKEKVSAVKGKAAASGKRPKVFVQIGVDPLFSANRNTIINDIIETAGGDNMTKDYSSDYPSVSIEEVISQDPDYIIIASMGGFGVKALESWKQYTNMKAVRGDKVFLISPDYMCNIGPRLADGAELVSSFLNMESVE